MTRMAPAVVGVFSLLVVAIAFAAGTTLLWPGGPVDGTEAPVPDFDPAAAGKLLDAAGWLDTNKDGIRDQGPDKQLKLVLYGVEKPAVHDASGPPAKTERDYFVEAARRATSAGSWP